MRNQALTMDRTRLLLITLLVATFAIGLAACGSDDDGGDDGTMATSDAGGDSTLDRLKSEGKITIGFANETPFAFTGDDGEVTGSDWAVLNVIMDEIGIPEIEGVTSQFASLIPGLAAGRFDMIATGIAVRPERCEQIRFGNPNTMIQEAMLVKKGNPLNIESYEDLVDSDIKLGVQKGSAEEALAGELGIENVSEFPSLGEGVSAMQAGRIDALGATELGLDRLIENYPDVEQVDPFTQPTGADGKPLVLYLAPGFPQDADDLRNAYNEKLVELRDSGELLSLTEEFGFTEANIPPADVESDELCNPTE